MNKVLLTISNYIPFSYTSIAETQDSTQVQIDRTPVVQKEFTETLSEKYTGKDYDYDVIEGEAENFLSRVLRWFFESIAELFGFQVSPEVFTIIKILFYLALGGLVLYIAIKLLVGEGSSSFFTRKEVALSPLKIQEDHIEKVDLDAFIKEALAARNYRLAVRYMFLKSLKQLSVENLIHWHFDKTNTDYYNELEDPTLKTNFKQIAYLYDNIWYGEYALDEQGYYQAKQDFDQLNKRTKHAR